jgi:hypothetical protein
MGREADRLCRFLLLRSKAITSSRAKPTKNLNGPCLPTGPNRLRPSVRFIFMNKAHLLLNSSNLKIKNELRFWGHRSGYGLRRSKCVLLFIFYIYMYINVNIFFFFNLLYTFFRLYKYSCNGSAIAPERGRSAKPIAAAYRKKG